MVDNPEDTTNTGPAPTVDLPPEGRYGLVGREGEIDSLREAFRSNSVIVLVGPAGVGKTELACGLGRKLAETGDRPGGILYTSFEYGAGLTRVLHEIGTTLQGIAFARLSLPEQRRWIVDYIRNNPALIIWDNFEKVFGYLADSECQELVDLVRDLSGGLSHILVTCRDVSWVEGSEIEHGLEELGGLSEADVRQMAEAVLEGAPVDPLGSAHEELLGMLWGNPQAMRLVLPHIQEQGPQTLVQVLRSSCCGAADAGAVMEDALEVSFSLLSPRTQKHLPFLSIFQQRVLVDVLTFITQGDAYPKVMDEKLGWGACRSFLREARNEGLLDSISPSVYLIPSSVSSFLRRRLEQQISPSQVSELEEEFVRVYTGLGDYFLESLATEESESTVTGVIAEEGNLLQSLRLAESGSQWDAVQFVLQPIGQVYKMQERILELRRLREGLLDRIGRDPAEAQRTGAQHLWMYLQGTEINDRVERREMDSVESICHTVLGYLDTVSDEDVQTQRASTYHYLGLASHYRAAYEEAEDWYRKSLEINEPLGYEAESADNHHQLGLLAHARKRYQEADEWHVKGIEIRERLGDEAEVAAGYHQLGLAAEGLVDLNRAFDMYIKAQGAYERLEDKANAAAVYHRLGLIAQAHFDYEDASGWYQRALLNYEELEDEDSGANDLFQLGVMVLRRQEYEEAEEWLRQALEAYRRTENEAGDAHACHQLGVVAHAQGRSEEAEEWYRRALESFLSREDDISAASTWGQLGLLADHRGNYAHAVWYVAHTYEIAREHDLALIDAAKGHLSDLRARLGDESFLACWQEVSDSDVLSDLEPA